MSLSTHSASGRRILIVDDEPHVLKFLRLSLQTEGFIVLEASTAEAAIVSVYSDAPDLMILDLGLPDIDGRQVIRDVRLKSDMPILVLSGRAEDSEKIAALEQGADDYMTKPFATKVLIQRVNAALQQHELRRTYDSAGSVMTGELMIHLNQQQVMRGDRNISLNEDEYALLRVLAMHGGRVLTYGRIVRALWGQELGGDGEDRLRLQKGIHALRRKLEAEPVFPRYIMTEPAVGYRLEILPMAER